MIMSEQVIPRTYDDFIADPYNGALEDSFERYWYDRTLSDVIREMPEPKIVPIDDYRNMKVVEIAPPVATDHEISHDIVLSLPHLNAYDPRYYIRAKTLQLANPNYSVWLMPNNTFRDNAYIFNAEEKYRLAHGDMRPLGEIQMRALENHRPRLLSLAVSGYSQGGLAALALAGIKNGIPVSNVNADEIPSKSNRTMVQLIRDFSYSRSTEGLRAAVADAAIPALSEVMNSKQISDDNKRFLAKSVTPEGQIMRKAMTGSAEYLVQAALDNGVAVKLGYVATSRIFDVESISPLLRSSQSITVFQYEGEKFENKHATGDNVKLHALMANDGLRLP